MVDGMHCVLAILNMCMLIMLNTCVFIMLSTCMFNHVPCVCWHSTRKNLFATLQFVFCCFSF